MYVFEFVGASDDKHILYRVFLYFLFLVSVFVTHFLNPINPNITYAIDFDRYISIECSSYLDESPQFIQKPYRNSLQSLHFISFFTLVGLIIVYKQYCGTKCVYFMCRNTLNATQYNITQRRSKYRIVRTDALRDGGPRKTGSSIARRDDCTGDERLTARSLLREKMCVENGKLEKLRHCIMKITATDESLYSK